MSLADQISHTVTTLASTSEARHMVLGRIRNDVTRHLREAHAARRRMASEQQHRLSEALRTIKLGTAILLGEADERIDRYRKGRVKQASRLNRTLAEGVRALRSNTRKWISTQSAMRRKLNVQDLRHRQQDRKALAGAVIDLTKKNLAFLATLTQDRQEASTIWLGRAKSSSAIARGHRDTPHAKVAAVKTEPVKVEAVDEQVKVQVAPLVDGAKHQQATMEVAKPETPKDGAPQREPAKGAGPATVPAEDIKPAASKTASEKSAPGKSM